MSNITMMAWFAQGQQQPTAPWWVNMVPLGLMIVVFYFILIRPQQKKAKELEQMIKSIKPGNKVLTGSGIIAVVVNVKEKSVTLRSADSKFEVIKSAITEVLERDASESESEPPRKS